jgi:hypothetical protein
MTRYIDTWGASTRPLNLLEDSDGMFREKFLDLPSLETPRVSHLHSTHSSRHRELKHLQTMKFSDLKKLRLSIRLTRLQASHDSKELS